MKDLVAFIVESLVDNPDEVQVTEVRGRGTTVVELAVAQPDMGRVIGKSGRVIDSHAAASTRGQGRPARRAGAAGSR